MPFDTIPSRLMRQARLRPSHPAYYEKSGGVWRGTGYGAYAQEVRRASRALLALGCERGSVVAMLGFNRPEWTTLELAAMCIGGAACGIYTTSSPSEVRYIVQHAEARVVLVENVEQWEKLNKERHNMPALAHVVLMRGAQRVDDPIVLSWEAFLAKGEAVDEARVDESIAALEPNQLALLVYTSGTTGPPKAVMLSHMNLAWTASVATELARCSERDCILSYLPLSHIAEQVFSIHAPITVGASIYFAESIDSVQSNLKEVRPTVFLGVPRVWEKFETGIATRLATATGVKKRLAEWAMVLGSSVNRYRLRGHTVPSPLAMQHALAEKLVYSKIKVALGLDRARFLVVGAAPIAASTLEFLASLGIVVNEVYGQSEGSGPTSINHPNAVRFGTVGQALPGVDVRIAEDGEVCVKGPNVFLGYYKDRDATAQTLISGWMHSGDLGELDSEGYLTITGRKKEIVITAGGKNISPANIENALKNYPIISEAVVIGDRRKFLSALITLDEDKVEHFLAENGVERSTPPHEVSEVLAEVARAIKDVNESLARVEQVKKFTVLPHNFSLARGELTPTLKIKRRVIVEHYAAEIEAMYAE